MYQPMTSAFVWQIFTEDLPEVEALPRERVLNFLRENFKSLAIPYLVRTQIVAKCFVLICHCCVSNLQLGLIDF